MTFAQVLVVIPVFKPGESVNDAIAAMNAQAPVMVVDDGSPATFDRLLRDIGHRSETTVVRFPANAGIARSLNAGLNAAQGQAKLWILTVDQDSSPSDGLIEILLEAAHTAEAAGVRVGAVGCGQVIDEAGAIQFRTRTIGEGTDAVVVAEELIQTGTLWRCEALLAIGGFDEQLRIDGVDSAACLRLRSAGWELVIAPHARIGHELGRARSVRLLGREVLATGHGPDRRETIVRNRLRLLPEEFALSPTAAARSLRRLLVNTSLAVTVEDQRWAKAKGSLRGLFPRRGQ